jgi:stress response protein YsnF
MQADELSVDSATAGGAGETTIPLVEEEARIIKRASITERVTVRTALDEEQVVLRDELSREHVEVVRVPVNREVSEAPPIQTDGDLTIIPVLEERLVVEKRLFVVEELHLRRSSRSEPVEVPTTVRRTRVEIDRENFSPEED